MKKIYLTIFAVLFSFSSFAQDNSQHLTFKGMPIDGSLTQFIAEMNVAGFTYEGIERGVAVLSGDFAGYRECLIVINTLTNKDLVNAVVVVFPQKSTWSMLENNYLNLKEMLTTKYGQPDESIERFKNHDPGDDNSRLYELKMDRCVYESSFYTDNGLIVLSIAHDDLLNCYVTLTYVDKINFEEGESSAINDL